MQVILLERVEKLGTIGDEVEVKNGFARNYLIPQGKALLANDANRARFEAEKAEIEARNEKARAEAASNGESLDGTTFVLIRQAGENGYLFGSVAARDVAEAATEAGTKVERRQVLLNTPIKTIGLHEVEIRLHPEVTITVTMNVARSEDEAERQAAGENVIEAAMAEQRAEEAAVASEMAEAAAEAAAERGPADED
ncbi:50S ribosomal protein L9 [Ponticaulis sp.]|jgi:large subunit ribosomal protein L9|uniref:50S ribosomal protein L9 n=1 Tax=Ponticaulis sp. TaxID=2020902 RepID=UPI000C615325|nr:50S ribosomal protein L9 [Ponticaulis sp.]MAF58216.1 50S ribosomal protein L9 [Ponticaulis sp.]MBN04223.1 50S ribosomal protein L9 [Ponticaulis sp.]|tara:strand:+ start:239 stop:829 length:591 start_codon:yes stop_codon:yes gene_type:complete